MLILVTAGAGAWLYEHLNGNIKSVAIDDGADGKEKADAFGRTPINLLVIGSDGRNNAADCKLGGGCGSASSTAGHNADVEMVVHVSADRSNATVMSVPRDTMTNVPACKDPGSGQSTGGYYGQINSALQYGAACQVKTVHQLTGIPIDHFVMLDFSGVVKMSDAVGGVSVCVSDNVYDTYSHLKLAKGTHTLQGEAALEFVRSRHGFGDGSDLGRTVSQHLFLGAMIRKFKSAGTLGNPAKVYSLADAATNALTVDTGLGSVGKLRRSGDGPEQGALAADDVHHDADRGRPDQQGARRARGRREGTVRDHRRRPVADVEQRQEGERRQEGLCLPVRVCVGDRPGLPGGRTGRERHHHRRTRLSDRRRPPRQGLRLGHHLGQRLRAVVEDDDHLRPRAAGRGPDGGLRSRTAHLAPHPGSASGIVLVIGSDWPSGTSYGSAAPADTHAAVADAHAQTADKAKNCAEVSPYKTVQINGVAMTPTQAYAAAAGKRDSAP